ncbi:HAMP domain-containing protein [Plectonema cf. radiosum LEGE 06105]|uniref:HAMP domain-containing protein n=1 Tax=Plectonema cf. radiosum LEGE 06105 TaxID=945769 RepID=A0A8J7FBN1_9CYAN|nr:methyl-accepting chemotaxis protein [Plectonema radiosum]MBE9213278.1 HAMP domain-containing protein [Plectonema cf. radiosum LEGE 06105]
MAPSIDYTQIYQQAYKAYVQKDYQQAAQLIDQVVQHLTDDPNTHLLRGHIYYVLQKYDVAQGEYEAVLNLTDNPEIVDFARNGLENINNYQNQIQPDVQNHEVDDVRQDINLSDFFPKEEKPVDNFLDDDTNSNSDSNNFAFSTFNENEEVTELLNEPALTSPFDLDDRSQVFDAIPNLQENNLSDNPFAQNEFVEADVNQNDGGISKAELELPSFWQQDIKEETAKDLGEDSILLHLEPETNSQQNPFVQSELPPSNSLQEEDLFFEDNPVEDSESFSLPSKFFDDDFSQVESKQYPESPENLQHQDDSFDLEAFEEVFGTDDFVTNNEETKSVIKPKDNSSSNNRNNIEYLDEFDEFDDLGNISAFDLSTGNPTFSDILPHSGSLQTNGNLSSNHSQSSTSNGISNGSSDDEFGDSIETDNAPLTQRDAELFSISGSQEAVPVFTQNDRNKIEPQVNVDQGIFAVLENAPLQTKQWLTAGMVGITSSVVVAVVSFGATSFSAPNQRESIRNTGWAMSLAAGIAGFVTAGTMGHLTLKQVRRTTKDLQTQFDCVRKGNLNAQATVYSEDEFGQLAAGFNEMARVIFTTTHEATRKAQEQEEAKENLQRQVIRLLDDVEGAARGDLTVQAEVTADVLGAVADAFNLTIQNLRDIVQQVKVAAREVTKGATNSETFARALSSDALRQAEELAVTLNSVQVMTDSIQRVAEAAREAEAVARDASEIALKGGEAVENTVAGILEIRETVAETTRKVKRLAESSQEISKIVALISQIASRTNLLALNASIEAARAGESGRGFAIVADEVRQLADKSAKSLKEIEQIVMQIQSETGSVMTAMEEGTQQVIKGTKLAEEAKRSLENIIQVANRIDILVRSITTDTVEQTETSRAVAQVMQSVELTAQETSQEAQRVSGALQHLVGVSRDLISSVERFRVETAESR